MGWTILSSSGKPDNGVATPEVRPDQVTRDYCNVNLNTVEIIERDSVKDASEEQIERAFEYFEPDLVILQDGRLFDAQGVGFHAFSAPAACGSLQSMKRYGFQRWSAAPG